jgi:hypothetical protein
MPVEKEPSADQPRNPSKLGRLPVGHFIELPNGEIKRLPTTMLRPPTWREAMLYRPATSTDIIGVETVLREADELRELRRRFDQGDAE